MGYNAAKKAMRRVFTLSLFLFLVSSHLIFYAQVDKRNVSVDNSFFKLCADNNAKFRLRSYGLYENGKEVNKFYTKDNENEYIQFANSYFYRTISSVGDFRYSYTISGNKIVFTNEEKRNSNNNLWTTINSNPQSWIKIQKAEIIDNGISVTLRIMSIDNNNTYRYYFIVEETPVTLQGQFLPSESSKKTNNTGVNNSSYNYNNSYNNSYNNYSSSRTCSLCNGSGRCCGAGNVAFSNQYCGGTGRCHPCYGTGWITNTVTGNKMKCTYCGGSGVCSHCRGTGSCERCGGSGKH